MNVLNWTEMGRLRPVSSGLCPLKFPALSVKCVMFVISAIGYCCTCQCMSYASQLPPSSLKCPLERPNNDVGTQGEIRPFH